MMVILQKMILKKLLSKAFYVTTSCFSSIRFVIIPSTPKLFQASPRVCIVTREPIQSRSRRVLPSATEFLSGKYHKSQDLLIASTMLVVKAENISKQMQNA